MNHSIVPVVVSVICGLFLIFASAQNSDFFFENKKAKFIVKFMGRPGARFFYGVLGLCLLGLAVKIFFR